jgi:tetratricopeptide (TPR) repeat protein
MFFSLNKFFIFIGVLALFNLQACLLPPTETVPQYLSEGEFKKVTNLNRAKELMLAGRFDDAELILRSEIVKNPRLSLQYNDLGYLLFLEDRFYESEVMLKKSVALDENFIAPRLNLARVLVALDRYNEAVDILDGILDRVKLISEAEYIKANAESRSPLLQAKVARLKASAYYLMGEYDEAKCYSYVAYSQLGSLEEASLHIRLLLSLESIPTALEMLRGAVEVHKDALPINMTFDYSLALVASANTELAKLVLDQVLGSAGLSQEEIAAARLLRFKLEDNLESEKLIKDSLSEDVSDPCKVKKFDSKGYWPSKATQLITQAYMEVCNSNEA